jgi:hypothetical protein
MFNDTIMSFYLFLSIYLILKNKPVWSAFFVSVGLSIKAGAFLILPALLGTIQMNYGTRTLLKCIIVMVAVQVVVALPFVLRDTTVEDYLIRSKLTVKGREGIAFAEEYSDYVLSGYPETVHWGFISEEFYKHKYGIGYYSKICIFILNIYHFFIRKNGLKPCLINLLDFLKLK